MGLNEGDQLFKPEQQAEKQAPGDKGAWQDTAKGFWDKVDNKGFDVEVNKHDIDGFKSHHSHEKLDDLVKAHKAASGNPDESDQQAIKELALQSKQLEFLNNRLHERGGPLHGDQYKDLHVTGMDKNGNVILSEFGKHNQETESRVLVDRDNGKILSRTEPGHPDRWDAREAPPYREGVPFTPEAEEYQSPLEEQSRLGRQFEEAVPATPLDDTDDTPPPQDVEIPPDGVPATPLDDTDDTPPPQDVEIPPDGVPATPLDDTDDTPPPQDVEIPPDGVPATPLDDTDDTPPPQDVEIPPDGVPATPLDDTDDTPPPQDVEIPPDGVPATPLDDTDDTPPPQEAEVHPF